MGQSAWGPLGAGLWWRRLAEASLRQGIQVALPLLVLIGATGQWDAAAAGATGIAALTAVAVAVLRPLAGLGTPEGASPTVHAVYRVVSAFAGSLAGILVANQATVLSVDWPQALTAAAASAAAAVLHGLLDPPASLVLEQADADPLTARRH